MLSEGFDKIDNDCDTNDDTTDDDKDGGEDETGQWQFFDDMTLCPVLMSQVI